MTRLTLDSDLRAKLGGLHGLVEVCDENGQIVGFFHPVAYTTHTQNEQTTSPISDEQIEAARRQTSGRPLADIWADLDRRV